VLLLGALSEQTPIAALFHAEHLKATWIVLPAGKRVPPRFDCAD
jgi:hypothetical protein